MAIYREYTIGEAILDIVAFILFFIGGIITGDIFLLIARAVTDNAIIQWSSAGVGFVLYYVVKHKLKKKKAEEKASEAVKAKKNEKDTISTFNESLEASFTNNGKKVSKVYAPSFSIGENSSINVGSFVIPSGVSKIIAFEYDHIHWEGFPDQIKIELLVNGNAVASRKGELVSFRHAAFDVKEGDVVSIYITTKKGKINGTLGLSFISDKPELDEAEDDSSLLH